MMCESPQRPAHRATARGRELAFGGHRTYGFGWLRLLIFESVPPENLISVSRITATRTPLFVSPCKEVLQSIPSLHPSREPAHENGSRSDAPDGRRPLGRPSGIPAGNHQSLLVGGLRVFPLSERGERHTTPPTHSEKRVDTTCCRSIIPPPDREVGESQ